MATSPAAPAVDFEAQLASAMSGPTVSSPAAVTPLAPGAVESPPPAAPGAPPSEAAPAAAAPAPAAEPAKEWEPPSDEDLLKPKSPEAAPAAAAEPAKEPAAAAAPKPEEPSPFAGMLPKEVESAFLATNRGKQILQAFKDMRDLGKPVEEGGIGIPPTPDQIKEWRSAASDQDTMFAEFASGEPDSAHNFLTYWFGPAQDGSPKPGAETVLSVLPSFVIRENPALLPSLAAPILNRYMSGVYDRAAREPNEEKRAFLMNLARGVEYDLLGKARSDEELPKPIAADPLTREKAALQREREELQNWHQQREQAGLQQFESFITSRAATATDKLLDSALEPVRAGFTPRSYAALRSDFANEIFDSIARNPEAMRTIERYTKAAYHDGSEESINALIKAYLQPARSVVSARRDGWLRDAAASAINASQFAHQQHAEASRSVGVNGGAAVRAPASTAESDLKIPAGTTLQDHAANVFARIMGAK